MGRDYFQPVEYISGKKLRFFGDEELLTFKKVSKIYTSRFLIDDTGRALSIEDLTVNINIHGDLVETNLDIKFTNQSAEAEEAELKLPLPSDAVVFRYALDINGQMVPAVAVPKQQAREAFETLENRGIDPGIAEITRGNQFSTEIYPISYKQQRRIQISYLVHAKTQHKRRTSYTLPIDQYGYVENLSINITSSDTLKPRLHKLVTKKGSEILHKMLFDTNKNSNEAKIKARSVTFTKPLELSIKLTGTHT